SDLAPLAGLQNLQTVNCGRTQVSDLAPLAGLQNLQTVNCGRTQVSDLAPLAGLENLQTVYCWSTQVSDLTPLAGLQNLQTVYCWSTQVSDLAPLAGLENLQTVDCGRTQVSDLAPLAGLENLQTVNCWSTQVSDLAPLVGLENLQTVNCGRTQVSDLAPLAGLQNLQTVYCSDTQVSDLAPLAGLQNLQEIDCSDTQVSDLAPLAGLENLQTVNCSGCHLSDDFETLWFRPSLSTATLWNTTLPSVPAEVLSQYYGDNCLARLRSHFRDLGEGRETIGDVKVMILGNGRVGKTKICRRLSGQDFGDRKEPSTHGIRILSAPLPHTGKENQPARKMQIWDFGGQDIYHGTHALFMKSRAIFPLVWTTKSEGSIEHEYGGMRFANQPLAYWLSYVRQFGGTTSPLIIIQNQCDGPRDEVLEPPLPAENRSDFPFCKHVHYSALKDLGRASLDDAIIEAIKWLDQTRGVDVIGAGRATVKRQLEEMHRADTELPVNERRNQVLSKAQFRTLCVEAGGISDQDLLLDYLHNTGTVFYQRELFRDRIILDQQWALDAIYSIFDRENVYQRLTRSRHGRFDRIDLASLLWDAEGYSIDEQKLFLTFMESCGVCFRVSGNDPDEGSAPEYIAPDLLPEESPQAVAEKWNADRPTEEKSYAFDLLPPGLMRGIISRIGSQAGLSGDYWRHGVYVSETRTGSRGIVEERCAEGWKGDIRVAAQRGQAKTLLAALCEIVEQEQKRFGLTAQASEIRQKAEEFELAFQREEAAVPKIFVSYAWGDETPEGRGRDEAVEALCNDARDRGITVYRDKDELHVGDRISDFMNMLSAGDRICIILSKKYLESSFCMKELYDIWRRSGLKDDDLLEKIRVYRLPCANIFTAADRLRWGAHWQQQYDELDSLAKEVGHQLMSEKDFNHYRRMQRFASDIGEILTAVADVVLPANIEDYGRYCFEDISSNDSDANTGSD
ncbi:leucine-rich repeat domain-containing protein, partial [Rhodobium gokarnense]